MIVWAWTAIALMTASSYASPTSPTDTLLMALPDPVVAQMVVCGGCLEPPFEWMFSEFDVSVGAASGGGGTIATVEAVVRNASRGGELGRNARPNPDHGLDVRALPVSGTVTVPMGVVFDVPPPRDQIELTVVVTATDGRLGSATTTLLIRASGSGA